MDNERNVKPFLAQNNSNYLERSSWQPTDQMDDSEAQKFDLSWLFGVVRRRLVVMASVAVVLSIGAGSLIIFSAKKTVIDYQGSFKLLVEPPSAEGRLAKQFLLAQNAGAELDKRTEESSFLDYESQIRVLKSPKIMTPVIEQLKAKYPEITYDSLMEFLTISRSSFLKDGKQQGTKILEITYLDPEPKKVMFVLETISKAYLTYSIQDRLTSITQGIDFIETELPKLQQRVDNLQGELQKLRQESTLLEPALEGRSLTEQGQSLQNQAASIRIELSSQREVYNNLQKQLTENGGVAILMTEAKAYETLLGQIQKVNADLAMKSARYREDSAPILALRDKQEQLMLQVNREAKGVIMERVAMNIRELEAREQAIAESKTLLGGKITEYSANARKYAEIQGELEVITKSLQQFLAKREALRIDAAQQQEPWVLIAPPDLPRDREGKLVAATVQQTKKQLVLAIVLSSLLAIVVGFMVEVLNAVYHTPEEAKAATKLPLLGVIPFAKGFGKNASVVEGIGLTIGDRRPLTLGKIALNQEESDSTVLEAFRYLYTNIRLLSPQTQIRSLAIGSAVPGDGKSTVAIHLAQTAAAIGQRVLLVDADLRNPQLHHRLGVPNGRGLSDAIAKDIGLNDIIQRSPNTWAEEFSGEDNLFVLTAGSIPNDPIKLLSSKKMLYLMEQFQAFFDLVIYDTPPLVGLADSNIISAHTDGMVMVVKIDKTDRAMMLKALDGLKISGASVLGIVANGVKGYTPSTYVSSYKR